MSEETPAMSPEEFQKKFPMRRVDRADLPGGQLNIHQSVYFQRAAYQPVGIVHRFMRLIESHDPPFELPTFMVGEDWVPILMGHLKNVGMIVLKNNEGAFTNGKPTAEQRKQMLDKTVEIALSNKGADLVIPPGESLPFTLAEKSAGEVLVRCRGGVACCSLIVVPK